MAYSINKVTLVGNVGNDPEVRSLQSGNKVVNLSLATSERWKDKETGEMKSNTEWHKVVIFNAALADIAEKYIKKGAKILHISEGSGIKLEVSFVRTPRIRKSIDIFNLDDLAIKGIQARGNKVSNKSVQGVKIFSEKIETEMVSIITELKNN